MRFKKGSIVEVLSNNELPSGSWRCAEVAYGNGHTYTVEYKADTCVSHESMVERVSRNSIRPSPPPVDLPENLICGDVLEVFQKFSWKMATVCKVLGRNEFFVRLVGFSHEFKVCRSELRVRQSWQDGKWFVIGKNIGNSEVGNHSQRLLRKQNQQLNSQVTRVQTKMNPYDKGLVFTHRNPMESPITTLTNRKRGFSYAHSEVEVPVKKARKLKVIGTIEGTRHCLPEKVVNNAIREKKLGDNDKYYGAFGHACEIRLKPNDEDNITCSVGSCSITSNDIFKSRLYFSRDPVDAECSDAESVCYGDSDLGNNLPKKMECAEEIRRLELQAYRCTMEALHACGPLSWEQETLVTNLRLSLNISNDEHLIELRHLASIATSLSFR